MSEWDALGLTSAGEVSIYALPRPPVINQCMAVAFIMQSDFDIGLLHRNSSKRAPLTGWLQSSFVQCVWLPFHRMEVIAIGDMKSRTGSVITSLV